MKSPLAFVRRIFPTTTLVGFLTVSWVLLQAVPLYSAPSSAAFDCNGNGVSDIEDLVRGTSSDRNSNDVPDECESFGLGLRSLVGRTSLLLDAVPRSLLVGDYNGDGIRDVGAGTWGRGRPPL